LNGTNGSQVFPYKAGGGLASNTMTFTAPTAGLYSLTVVASFGAQSSGTFGVSFCTLGLDYNGSANPNTSGTLVQQVQPAGAGAPAVVQQLTWTRQFNAGDTSRAYVFQNTSGSTNVTGNWMSAVRLA
jgi:hypothetical protein